MFADLPSLPNMNPILPHNSLFTQVASLLDLARRQVVTTVNLTMVRTYFEIGRPIVEDEQHGNARAEYGKTVLKDLSQKLSTRFGKGFSVDNLQNMRQFYASYSIYETPSRIFRLSWSHYLILMRIGDPDQRSFYEIESTTSNWSLRELQRQLDSALYERLVLSRDKDKIKELSEKGQLIQQPQDLLKDPYILDFLGLSEDATYSESHLETRIINNDARSIACAVAFQA